MRSSVRIPLSSKVHQSENGRLLAPGPWLPEPSPRTELELERKRELVDTFDTKMEYDFEQTIGDTGSLVSRKG
ncbi:MAG: hypothetical protein BA863_15240 [Desulfovibrio sp. S3730MH75]|nr:MAG: hypothetical protein BA863_15240 [Desulfovibrio sp. S3730MH75]